MSNPIDLVKQYVSARISSVPKTPYTQEQSNERYSAENEKAINEQTESQTQLAIEINKDLEERYERKRRYNAEEAQYDEEPIPTREQYELNQQNAEREMENNSQRELDDLDESEPALEGDKFSGNYFEKPDFVRNKKQKLIDDEKDDYESESDVFVEEGAGYNVKEKVYDTVRTIASDFGESFGSATGAVNAKYSKFKRGDPIFSVRQPAKRGKSPYTRVSRSGQNISRPYIGGRFGGDELILGTANTNNLYYPVVNEGRKSASTQDMYLPSGAVYEGEFSGRKAFKREFSDERERYDPFGYGGLSGDGFDNTSPFGSSLMGFGGDNGIFGGSAGHDNVFGNFGGGRTGKMDILGDSGMFAIGDLVSPPASRKTTTRRRASTRKTTKKVSKAKPTKRKPTTRRQSYTGFALP